jgi:DNA-binding NarL/FixJ family response regulator
MMTDLLLADDQDIFRAGVARLVATDQDFRIVAQCKDVKRLENAMQSHRNATVIVASSLLAQYPCSLATIQENNGHSIVIANAKESAQPFFDRGAQGVMYRSATGAMLLDCLRRVLRGEQKVQCVGFETPQHANDAVGARVRDRMTPKELNVLSLLMQGCRNREIGVQMGTTEQVIKNCLRNIFDKVGVSDRLELGLFTIHHPLLASAAACVQVCEEVICI